MLHITLIIIIIIITRVIDDTCGTVRISSGISFFTFIDVVGKKKKRKKKSTVRILPEATEYFTVTVGNALPKFTDAAGVNERDSGRAHNSDSLPP